MIIKTHVQNIAQTAAIATAATWLPSKRPLPLQKRPSAPAGLACRVRLKAYLHACGSYVFRSGKADEDRPEGAGDTVNGRNVKRIVNAESVLDEARTVEGGKAEDLPVNGVRHNLWIAGAEQGLRTKPITTAD